MPPLRQTRFPEVIVTVARGLGDRPVFALRDDDPTALGVLPDPAGKAWFELPVAERYTLAYPSDGGTREVAFDARYKPLRQKPGYDYIDRVTLGE